MTMNETESDEAALRRISRSNLTLRNRVVELETELHETKGRNAWLIIFLGCAGIVIVAGSYVGLGS